MRYCGVAPAGGLEQLCALEELRTPEPPVRLRATFYEPGSAAQVLAELRGLGALTVAVGQPAGEKRACDEELARRGIQAAPQRPGGRELYDGLRQLGLYLPEGAQGGEREGQVEEGAYHRAAAFETSVEGAFAALHGRRLPARRHPLGVARRIEELADDHVEDEGGDLWHRRIEELEAAACALAAHRYALAHANWLGDPGEAVIVLPGARAPERFSTEGVIPAVPRRPLPSA